MKKVCYFCGRFMGVKGDYPQAEIFYSVCDECASRLRIEERLPELLWAIAALRKKNRSSNQGDQLLHLPLPPHTDCNGA